MLPLHVVQEYARRLNEALHAKASLTEEQFHGIERAFAQKGKFRGKTLKRKAPSPSADPWAYCAWVGIQPNKYKVMACTGSMMLYMTDEQRQWALDLGKVKWPDSLDQDKAALVAIGVW